MESIMAGKGVGPVVMTSSFLYHFTFNEEYYDAGSFISCQHNIYVTQKRQLGLAALLTTWIQLSNYWGNRKISTGPYRHNTRDLRKKNRENPPWQDHQGSEKQFEWRALKQKMWAPLRQLKSNLSTSLKDLQSKSIKS